MNSVIFGAKAKHTKATFLWFSDRKTAFICHCCCPISTLAGFSTLFLRHSTLEQSKTESREKNTIEIETRQILEIFTKNFIKIRFFTFFSPFLSMHFSIHFLILISFFRSFILYNPIGNFKFHFFFTWILTLQFLYAKKKHRKN